MLTGKPKYKNQTLKLSLFNGDKLVFDFPLDKKKMLIGNGPHADIIIKDGGISFYHAFIILDDHGGGEIIDLASKNGTFINGKRTQKSFFSEGDLLRFGELEFTVFENLYATSVINFDENIKEILIQDLIIPIKDSNRKGLILIDGEYCDITFEENYSELNELPIGNTLDFSYFVDYQEEQKGDSKKDILKQTKGKSVEVSILSMGNIISVDYLPLNGKDQDFFFSRQINNHRTVILETLEEGEHIPFLKITNGKIHACKVSTFQGRNLRKKNDELFKNSNIVAIDNGDIISYRWKSVQIFVRLTDGPPRTKFTPFFSNDKEFQKEASKVFSILFSIMLLLLFVDITPPAPEEKKLAIIYKRAPKIEKQQTPEANNTTQDNEAVKEHHKPDKKIEMAKKSEPAATAKTSPTEIPVAPAKMAAYEFKSTSLNSLFNSDSMKNVESAKNGHSAATAKNFESIGSDTSALKTGTGTNINSLGSDSSGNGKVSSGAKGLFSKNGTDSTYIEPKTVILGSIDPELLRKILQEYIPQFRHCYQQELENNEAIQGVVDLNFRIENNGSVSKVNIKVKSSSFSANGTSCMGNVLKLIDFPKPKGGGHVDVKQPLNFFSERNKM